MVATRGGKRPYQPALAFVHLFPLGTPKVDSPSQRRQGTAERGKCPQTVTPGRGGRVHLSLETPQLMPHSASRGGVDDPVVAGARTPRRREHTRQTGAPAVSVSHTPGRGRCYLSVETPRPMLHSARRGGVVVTGQALRPGRGLCAHARVGGRTPVMQGAPGVAGSRTPSLGVGYGTGQRALVVAGGLMPGRGPMGGGRGALPFWRPPLRPPSRRTLHRAPPFCSAPGWVFRSADHTNAPPPCGLTYGGCPLLPPEGGRGPERPGPPGGGGPGPRPPGGRCWGLPRSAPCIGHPPL